MADHRFFEVANGHNQRQLSIVNVTLLVGKSPTKEKRIRVKARMVLSVDSNIGAPEWITSAHVFVAREHTRVVPKIEFRGYDIQLSDENLFGPKNLKANKVLLRSFEVDEFGESENPDVALNFTLYIPFGSRMWNWLGQYGGDEVWCSFTPGVDAFSGKEADGAEEAEDDAAPDEEPEPKAKQKSGPKQLEAFHQAEVAKDGKKTKGKAAVN